MSAPEKPSFIPLNVETDWQDLANAMPQLVWFANPQGEVLFYNDRVSEFAGAHQVNGVWRWQGLLHPDDRESTAQRWAEAISTGKTYEMRHRVALRDGSYRWFLSRAVPKKDPDGAIVRWYGTATDIHQQKLYEERLDSIFAQTSVGIAQCSLEGKLVLVNDRYCEITGRSKEELYSLTIFDITYPEDLQTNYGLLDTALKKGTPFNFDKRYVRPDGTLVWVNIHVNIGRDESGIPSYILGVCHDITGQVQAKNALRESEQRFRTMADAAPNMVWSLNPDGSVKYINRFARDFFGLRDGEWPDKFRPFVHPDDLEAITQELLESIQKGINFVFEGRFWHHSGVFRYMLVQGAPSYYPDGKMYGYIGSAIDIDDRKRFEQELEYQHQLTQTITDNATDCLFLIDDRGICTFLNPAAEILFGYKLEELNEKALHDYVHYLRPDGTSYPLEECPIGHAIFRGIPLKDHEDVFISRTGTFIPVKCSAKRVNKEGDAMSVLVQVRDITEEKRASEALRESEERFRMMADNISPLAWMASENGTIFWYNKRWWDYTGTTSDEMQKHGWRHVLHPDYSEQVLDNFMASVRAGVPWEDTFPLKSGQGHYRWFLSRATPIKDENGKVLRWFGTNIDITERKETEEAIKMMANNLEKLVVERTIALQRSNEDLQQFAHVASHDLKEPLRKIKTFSNRLLEEYSGVVGEKGAIYLHKISNATERMFNMIEGVLNYSTINATSQKPSRIDLNEVVQHIESDLELVMQEKSAVIRYNFLPVVEGASVLIYQLFYNLINNSLKFARTNVPPVITIHTEPSDPDKLRIIVQDNGIGFEQEYAEKIFHTFTRLNSKDKYEGTGLGLALCKKIVELHKGTIQAIGSKEKGATFIIDLPKRNPSLY